ncbi:hypothetical protein JCM8547_003171 [Rhodosporidiobolus lusitaniae]
MCEPVQDPAAQADAAVAPSPHPVEQPHPQLALPAPPEQPAQAFTNGAIKLDVSTGESVSLYDTLGPTVVNSDGTLSRIADWAEKTEAEKKNILRVLGKRNQARLDAKKAELAGRGQGSSES